MRRRGKTFLSLFLSAVIVTGQPVLAADFSAGEETFISETTEQEGDVSEASAIFEDTVDSDSEMRSGIYYEKISGRSGSSKKRISAHAASLSVPSYFHGT